MKNKEVDMLTYILDHLTIAMIITGLIGIFGNMIEPGPTPKLMIITASVYLLVGAIVLAVYTLIKNRRRPVKKTVARRKFQMYDMKESA